MNNNEKKCAESIGIVPRDILVGLGTAERGMLATFLALFDDSALISRIKKLAGLSYTNLLELAERAAKSMQDGRTSSSSEADTERFKEDVESRRKFWESSPYSDDALRLLLWVRLREALRLPARLAVSTRAQQHLGDDLAAALIHALDPPSLIKSGKSWLHEERWLEQGVPAITLEDVIVPVLDELLAETLKASENPPSKQERRAMLRKALSGFKDQGMEAYARHLKKTGANQANDNAILITALMGGGLGAFGATVSAMGFGAYIAAAKASAFIPMVSGPGLSSFVSVLSNPVTILIVVTGGGWYLARTARQKAELAVASRVIALLALKGLQTDSIKVNLVDTCFYSINSLSAGMGIDNEVFNAYRKEWGLLRPVWERPHTPPSEAIMNGMGTSLPEAVQKPGKTQPKPSSKGNEWRSAAALGTLTIGDALYNYAAIDPMVVKAADFSRAMDIDGRLDFSVLAHQILDGTPASVTGAHASLKGYVAEMAVAEQLVKTGHTVSFPSTSNEKGWDLLVDGEKFQVKFHANVQGVKDHFSNHDYPVIANTELEGNIPAYLADKVFFVDGVSNELVDQVTRNSLADGANILDHAPIHLAGIVPLTRGLLAYYKDQVTAKQAFEQILLDGSVRIGLFGVGGALGVGVGAMMFGPAGAWVFGAGAPVLAQMQTSTVVAKLKDWMKGKAHKEWESAAHSDLDDLQKSVLDALLNKRNQIDDKLAVTFEVEQVDAYIRWRLTDDDRFIQECMGRVKTITRKNLPVPEQRVAELLRCLAYCGVHPYIYQNYLHAIEASVLERPGLSALLDDLAITKHLNDAKVTLERGRAYLLGFLPK